MSLRCALFDGDSADSLSAAETPGSKDTSSEDDERRNTKTRKSHAKSTALYPARLRDFARYIPLRLNERERSLLNVLESTLNVTEYTDNVDISGSFSSKTQRIIDGIIEVCNIATGLTTAAGLDDAVMAVASSNAWVDRSESLDVHPPSAAPPMTYKLASRSPRQNADFLRDLYEIGRRNKVLNPSRMRGSYGKLMYLLQDAQSPAVAKTLGFCLYKELVMVGPYLEQFHRGLEFLEDSRLVEAVQYVDGFCHSTGRRLSRKEVDIIIAYKREVTESLLKDYIQQESKSTSTNIQSIEEANLKEIVVTDRDMIDEENESNVKVLKFLNEEELRRCIDSIADAVATCVSNVKPVKRMLQLLEERFDPNDPKKNGKYSNLTLTAVSRVSSYNMGGGHYYGFSGFGNYNENSNSEGATLSHSHPTQFVFVWQSLKLWCEVQKNIHQLWVCADDDLLSTQSSYSLRNTGQGLNRVQSCPRVGSIMRQLLSQVQREAGSPWVGLSVIHLGDRDVPNALIFIDKYTQIPRFLRPLVDFVDGLDAMCSSNDGIGAYITKEFGGIDQLKMMVLCDYFKHGFDGSGDDGGSCIDGRLTSSWNWTSRLAKKRYYHAFMLSGFQGFDGEFK